MVDAANVPASGDAAILDDAEGQADEAAGVRVGWRRLWHSLGADNAVQFVLAARERLDLALSLSIDAEVDGGRREGGAQIRPDEVYMPECGRKRR